MTKTASATLLTILVLAAAGPGRADDPAPARQPAPAGEPALANGPPAPASQPSEETGSRRVTATLTGEAVVPVPGDPDGRGEVSLDFDPAALQVCFSLTVSNIAPASAAHVHSGAKGSAGSVVVTLTPAPTDGASAGCVGADAELIKSILKEPGSYYVNISNPDYPNGALRGQLSSPASGAPPS